MDTSKIYDENFPNLNEINKDEYNKSFPTVEEINKIIFEGDAQKALLEKQIQAGGTISYTDKDGNWVEETKEAIKIVRDKDWNLV